MTFHSLCCCALAMLAAGNALAQEPMRFETISLSEIPPGVRVIRPYHMPAVRPGAVYSESPAYLDALITFAYEIPDPSINLIGLPPWADSTPFRVVAKGSARQADLSPEENAAAVRQMMRALLAERFHLQIHSEPRVGPIFHLQVARAPRLKQAATPASGANRGLVTLVASNHGGRLSGNGVTMKDVASELTALLELPVIDDTGSAQAFDLDIRWGSDPNHPGFGDSGRALLEAALRDKLGLVLKPGDGSRQVWIIDHAEVPVPE